MNNTKSIFSFLLIFEPSKTKTSCSISGIIYSILKYGRVQYRGKEDLIVV